MAASEVENNRIFFVFSSGGINGYAHIGVLHAFEEEYTRKGLDLYRNILGASGASAGAMMALGTVLGYRAIELKCFADEQLNLVASELRKPNPMHLYRSGSGMLKSDPIRRVIQAMIERKLGVTDITFRELNRRLVGVKLKFAAHNLDVLKGVLLSVDTTPDMSVVEACTASCMIPVVFESVDIDDVTYCDGGISNSLPFMEFNPEQTIKVYLSKISIETTATRRKKCPWSFFEYICRVIEAFDTATKVRLEYCDPAPHTQINIALPVEGVISLVVSQAARDCLYWYGHLRGLLWAHPEYVDGVASLLNVTTETMFDTGKDAADFATVTTSKQFLGLIEYKTEEQRYFDTLKLLHFWPTATWHLKFKGGNSRTTRFIASYMMAGVSPPRC
jgi:predicted acylesterase/phospholipase RssA